MSSLDASTGGVVGSAPSPPPPGASTTISDATWVASKYTNFKAFVRSLSSLVGIEEWSDWLDGIPIEVFLGGGHEELKGVRGADSDDKREGEAALVLERWGLQYGFEVSGVSASDKLRLTRYVQLFASL
jgi:hypothetical protein